MLEYGYRVCFLLWQLLVLLRLLFNDLAFELR